jgi:Putative auto-transporter adhesin, head GIN domain
MRADPLALSALACIALFSCACETASGVSPTGKVTRETFRLADFDGVEVSHAFHADIRQDLTFRVEVEADEAAMPYLDVRVRGGRLVLAMKPGMSLRNIEARATVTMPALHRLHMSGASRAKADGFSSDSKMNVEASGASRVEADVDTGDLDVLVSGASRVTLDGRGARLHAVASGASHAELEKFRVQESSAVASGASSVRVNTKGRMDAVASGASHITYTGNPIIGSINSSGASTIREAK